MKIIIVDDDKLVSLSIKTILMSHQIETLSIGSNAEEAILLYKQNTPDIILMDIRMGEKDGLYAAEEIIKYDKKTNMLIDCKAAKIISFRFNFLRSEIL